MSNKTAIAPIVVPTSQTWDGNDGPWSTFAIHVGNPSQPARVLVSTTLGESWVVSANETQGGCRKDDSKNCAQSRGALFNISKSTTWQDQGIFALGIEANLPDYSKEYGNGHYGLDSLGFGFARDDGIALDSLVVAAIATKDYYLGNLGITPRPTNFTSFDDPQTSLLSALKERKHIPSLSFGYSAGNTYRLKKVYGSLTLGGYDQSKFVPNGVDFLMAPDISRDLVVGLQSITYNDAKTVGKSLLSEGILTFVDSTVPHIWLPKSACTAFEEAFNLEYNSTVNRYLVNDTLHDQLQQNNASVSFILGNDIFGGATVNITLPYKAFDLEVGPPIVNDTSKYFPLRRAENDTQYTLGRTFLQESYLIVDYERSNFSISQSVFQETPEKIVAISPNVTDTILITHPSSSVSKGAIAGAAVGVVVLLSLIAGTVFHFIRRRRRRQQTEDEKRKAEEAFDPMNKPEMDGHSKLPPGELYTEGKLGSEVDGKSWNEMDASKEGFFDADKLRAEMEGTRGGTEMEGTKGGFEMQAGEVAAPVEMWAGSQGLSELPSAGPGDDGRPSPASRIPSSLGSGRPSPASASDQGRMSRITLGPKHQSSPGRPRKDNSPASSTLLDTISGRDSGTEAWSDRPSPRPTPPPHVFTPPEAMPLESNRRDRARRGDDLTNRLGNSSRKQSGTHLSVSSPTSDSESGRRRQTSESGTHLSVSSPTTDSDSGRRWRSNESGADRWNERFGSRMRDARTSPRPSISSPNSDSRSLERRLPPTPRDSPREEVSSPSGPSESSSRQALMRGREHDSWTSQVSNGGGSGRVSSPRSEGRGDARMPGGFF